MNTITVFLTTDESALRVSFAYDAALVERIKTIPSATWVKAGRYWALPVTALDKLIREFGDNLAIHPDVYMAASDTTPVMCFAETLRQAGITLTDVDGRLVGSGGCYCADPWQRLIDERADALRQLVPVTVVTKPIALPKVEVDLSKLTEIDRTLARGWDGLVERERKKAETIERRKAQWWQRKPEQPALIDG